MIQESVQSQDLPRQWPLEVLFYGSLFIGAFSHLIVDVSNVAPAMLVVAMLVALFMAPSQVIWAVFPLLVVLTMLLIDLTVYKLDVETIKFYLFWVMTFAVCLALHRDPHFFFRAKIILIIYLLANLIFLTTDPITSRLMLETGMSTNDLAYWCGFGIFASLVAASQSKWYLGFFFIGSALILGWVLLGTVSRGALLSVLATITIYFVLAMRDRRLFISLLVGLTGLAAVSYTMQSHVLSTIERFQERMEHEEVSDYSFSGRTELLDTAIQEFNRSPWVGTGDNYVSPPGKARRSSPHNAFYAIAVHYGILPTFCLLLVWVVVLWKLLLLALAKDWISNELRIELLAFSGFMLLMTNMSNRMILAPFSILYMTKILSTKPYN